jgi:hypothetical protein
MLSVESCYTDTSMSTTDLESLPRPAALWKQMTDTQRVEAARAFWNDSESLMEQAEVLALIARRLNFRLKTVQSLSLDRKVKHLMAMGNVSDAVAGRLLVTYHLVSERPMMAAFLDELGIAHDNGLIADTELARPDQAVLAAAADKLRGSYPRERTDLYFSTLVLQDPETWSGLLEITRAA